ncbi:MFS transporter [Rubellimicrobium rubrum]|uniref:MFS transporter n=1 Tax=Rubellimicrobium rubrum TaxID=2585369 RepID=A0A5C4N0B6_9RHOB|nr:MFS transporter [Rubellimicrobium rubrum]TNC51963.1 MFS transporter [Rubellimicrobium rubrum]
MSAPAAVLPASGADRPAWGPVLAMTLCVVVLIASEFLPVSLLTPMARDLGLTAGQAGQAISISGLFAVLTSLFVTRLVGTYDRRHVVIGMALLLAVSGSLVAAAPNFVVLMTGRALLGVAIGGFWSLNTAIIMRLLPAALVPAGLAVSNGGVAFASTVSAPLGSALGDVIGWRWTFFAVVPLALVAAAWQAMALPRLPAGDQGRTGGVLRLLRSRQIALGMAAILMFFMGQFALFTYLRPFLEQVTGVDIATLSALLLMIGVASLLGNALIGPVLRASLPLALAGIPLIMAGVALMIAVTGTSTWTVAGLLALWGLVATGGPVAWGTWLTRALPHDVEAGGGLQVAVIQLAITLGATAGGQVFDAAGPIANVMGSAGILALAGVAAIVAGRAIPRQA